MMASIVGAMTDTPAGEQLAQFDGEQADAVSALLPSGRG